MRLRNYILGGMAILLSSAAIISCKKNDAILTPPAYGEFVDPTGNFKNTFYIQNSSSSVFKIPVGITGISDKDRTLTISYSSPSGATQGVQYNAPTSIVIPAGKALDTLTIQGLFAGYPSSARVDTLNVKISGGDVGANAYNNTYTVYMRKYCDVVGANLIGDYANSTDTYGGAASTKPNYKANISNWVSTGPTSASFVIKNIGATSDNGWGPFGATDPVTTPGLNATADWSNPANFTVTIPNQNYFNDGTGMSKVTGSGTFSSCNQTFTISMTVVYAGNGKSYTHVSYLRR